MNNILKLFKIISSNRFTLFIITIIIFLGLKFRINGILDNHSFWSDEAFVSSLARDINYHSTSLRNILSKSFYQPLHILTITLFFNFLSFSEFSARLPSVLFGTIGIIFAYLVAKRLSNNYGAIISSFLYAFSQINLANSTQAKQYSAIQTIFLIIVFLMLKLQGKISRPLIIILNLLIILLISVAGLYHIIGFSFLIIYIIFFTITYYHILKKIKKIYIFITSCVLLTLVYVVIKKISVINSLFTKHNNRYIFFYNNTMYFKNLLLKQYGLYFFPAIAALILAFKKNRALILGLFSWIFLIFFIWNFQYYSHNIRYLLPFFGIMFVFFGVFWGNLFINSLYLNSLFFILIITMLFITQYKIVLKPIPYYSPNADFYGDVQIADYKTIFSLIDKKYPNLSGIAFFTDTIGSEGWYISKRPKAYLIKGFENNKPEVLIYNKVMVYKTLEQFLQLKQKNPKGLLLVEDWESLLPEDIKQYAKKNLKLEFKVEGLKEAKGDNWPLEVYSWGI